MSGYELERPRELLGMAESLGKIEEELWAILVVGRSYKDGRRKLEKAANSKPRP